MYGDFQCPFCSAAQPILRRVRERLDGRLRFAFRHFPLTEVHPDAQLAAEASEAAAAQGAFWPMHDALYAAGGRSGSTSCSRRRRPGARRRARAGRARRRHARGAGRGRRRRRRAAGVAGTPAFFVSGERHSGGYDAQSLIAALEGAG